MMLKRILLIAALLSIMVWLPMPTTTSMAAKAYTEGVHFEMSIFHAGTGVKVTATKHVDGKWRQTEVQIESWMGYDALFTGTALLSEDPDGLEVSRDLGWGGLEGQITMPIFHHTDMHVIEFHVSQLAREAAYTDTPPYFTRNATLDGYILLDGRMWMDFREPTPSNVTESAYNFSDQWPGY